MTVISSVFTRSHLRRCRLQNVSTRGSLLECQISFLNYVLIRRHAFHMFYHHTVNQELGL